MKRTPRFVPPPCPHCGAWTEVLETRRRPDGTPRRRLQCGNNHRFTLPEEVTRKKKRPC